MSATESLHRFLGLPFAYPARVLGVVCPEGRLVYRHTCDVSELLDLFDVL